MERKADARQKTILGILQILEDLAALICDETIPREVASNCMATQKINRDVVQEDAERLVPKKILTEICQQGIQAM